MSVDVFMEVSGLGDVSVQSVSSIAGTECVAEGLQKPKKQFIASCQETYSKIIVRLDPVYDEYTSTLRICKLRHAN